MKAIRILVGWAVLALAACAPVAPVPDASSLSAARIGEVVVLAGRFDGPAKIADFVRVDDEIVYLPDLAPGSSRPNYGTRVMVRGVLRHFEPPAGACEPGPTCFDAVLPAYWYLEAARIEAVMASEDP